MTIPAAAHEALGNKIPFTHNGEDFLVLSTLDWPFEAIEYFEEGKVAKFLRLVLGDEDYARMKKSNPTVRDVNEFSTALQKVLGIQGN